MDHDGEAEAVERGGFGFEGGGEEGEGLWEAAAAEELAEEGVERGDGGVAEGEGEEELGDEVRVWEG